MVVDTRKTFIFTTFLPFSFLRSPSLSFSLSLTLRALSALYHIKANEDEHAVNESKVTKNSRIFDHTVTRKLHGRYA